VAWKEVVATMSFRKEIIRLASQPGTSIRELCRRFKVSEKTFYKWRHRFAVEGEPGLVDRSRRPHQSPQRTEPATEEKIVSMRKSHRGWGARKIRTRLLVLGHTDIPGSSSVHRILRRNGQIDPTESKKHQPFQRFEHEAPNQLWQMDFKGWFRTGDGAPCHPLTVLDDHSRYVVCLQSCADQRATTVQDRLTAVFRCYGLPQRMTMDNGSPWGGDDGSGYTPLTAWLVRLGVAVSHSRPYHPQTQGKDERFHRTLGVELLRWHHFPTLKHVQQRFDPYRHIYNHERPHQALGMNVPASRYRISDRPFPDTLPAIEYDSGDVVRMVNVKGQISYHRQMFTVGKAFRGYPVAVRPTTQDGIADVYFCHQRITQIDVREANR
jgi:transposase InsO family protein